MHNVDLWVEKVCEENYEDLYIAGLRYLLRTNPKDIIFLPDDIQEVYLLLCRKKEKLIKHPNITGWLVRTMMKVMSDREGKARKERARIAFSMDDEAMLRKTISMFAAESDPLEIVLKKSADEMPEIEKEIGRENLQLLQAYYEDKQTSEELAGQMQMDGAALRMRISRLKKKMKDRAGI
jgi:DNA-directed RNA polymerase specialized sigma24 family protein